MQAVAEVTINSLSHSIELAIAPVFLLTGVAGILNLLNSRLLRVVDRSRFLDTEDAGDVNAAELPVLLRRRHAINRAIIACTLSALLVCVVIVLMFLGTIVRMDIGNLLAVLFIAAMTALIYGLLNFLHEIQLAVRFFRRETRPG